MSKNNNNTPRLRFPEFTGEWEEKKISDLFKISRGYVLPTSATRAIPDEEYKYPVYSSQTTNNGLMGFYNKALYKDAITWTTDGANAGTVKYRKGEFYCTNVCGVLTSTEGYANLCVAEILGAVTKNHVSYVGNPKLMNNVMAEIAIFIPPTPEEQKKIADCLSEMDNLISAQAQKVEALKDQKKGMMQQLFPQKGETTPRLRFPEFTGEWKEKRLKEIFVLRNGYTPLKGEDSYWTDGEIPWFRMEDIREKGNVLYDSTQHITQKAIKGKGCFNANTIILATSATIGEHALIKVAHLANQRFVNLEINPMYSREISIEYAYYYMYIIDEICKSIGNIGTFASVSTEALSNLLFVYPSTFAEQQKIADCLFELDDLIASETKQLEALKDHKKGLMQQLFPQPAK